MDQEDGYDPRDHRSRRRVKTLHDLAPIKKVKDRVKVVIGRTGGDICPVTALLRFLAIRGKLPGPLFVDANGKPLTKGRFVAEVHSALTRANLPTAEYASHSFRIGAATTAAAAGLEDSLIQTLGRWKSSAYLVYIRMDPRQLAAVSNSLANCSI